MSKNFPGWGVRKDMSPQGECLHQLPRQKNKNKSTSKHTIVKIQNSRDKEKILNATRREDRLPTKKQSLNWKQASHRWIDASGQWGNSFQMIRENNENCIWSKTGAVPTEVGHERIYFSKKKNESRRKAWDMRSTVSKEINKMYW